MDLHRLRTIVALSEHPSFSAAGASMGLSHSAVSLHVKELEAELGVALVDRARRPPVLTDRGVALVEQARRVFDLMDAIAALGAEETLVGTLSVGFAPSTMAGLAPPALAALRAAHPKLLVRIRTGLSADLAQSVRAGDLDAALTTAPELPVAGLRAREVAREPLQAIAPASAPQGDARALLTGRPFIWFSRKTWAGEQIERRLAERGIAVVAAMEVDSLEAVEALVRHGLGVSVAPLRLGANRAGLTVAPFGDPPLARVLSLLERPRNPRARLADALFEALLAGAKAGDGGRATSPARSP
jgi:DNA-binding transcriptional LysR family regulator